MSIDAVGPATWQPAPHCCRNCSGRIMRRLDVWKCFGCGSASDGATPRLICACGITTGTGKSAGFRCGPNPDPSGPNKSEIIIWFGDVPAIRGEGA